MFFSDSWFYHCNMFSFGKNNPGLISPSSNLLSLVSLYSANLCCLDSMCSSFWHILGSLYSFYSCILWYPNSPKQNPLSLSLLNPWPQQQGELMNRIENHVQEAQDYVDTAKQDTKKAIRYQSRARRVSTSTFTIYSYILTWVWTAFYEGWVAWWLYSSSVLVLFGCIQNWCCHLFRVNC